MRRSADDTPAITTHAQIRQQLIRGLQTIAQPLSNLEMAEQSLPEIDASIKGRDISVKKAGQKR